MDRDDLYQKPSVENVIVPEEQVVQPEDPLTLDLDDKTLVESFDASVRESRKFFKEKYNLYERRERMEMYLFGRQIQELEKKNEIKTYQTKVLDNVIYEIEAALKPLAMSRLPDMIVTPGTDNKDSVKTAEDVSKVLNTDLKKRENRQTLGLGFKHLPVYFTAVIKARWDPEKDDYVFEIVHPNYIDVDHTCNTKNADDMKWIRHILPITVQECLMQFPDKKEGLFEQLHKDGLIVGEGEPSTKEMNSEIKISEIWFRWYKKKETKKGEKEEWERFYGVIWKYKDVVLKKIKNPNFDYTGTEKYFSYDNLNDKSTRREISLTDLAPALMMGMMPENVKKETVYRNYFDQPRMPFFFFGYDQWRKIPYDETSRIEQNIRNQEKLDTLGRSIYDKLKERIKHIFSKEGGLKKEDIEQMDLDDPRQDILVDGDVNKVHSAIIPEQPSAQQFKEQDDTRTRMYSMGGANAIRGQLQTDVATSNQIAREADFTRADDLVEDTINDASQWMAEWSMQFIKLRYGEDHFRKFSGARGKMTFLKINRDMVEDGMEVQIKSSGTDKLKTEKKANDMALAKLIDPYHYFKDTGLDDPEGRTEDLMMFTTDPASYMAKIKGLGSTTPELISSLNGVGTPTAPPTTPAAGSVQAPQQPASPVAPQVPTPQNTAAVPPTPTGPPPGSPRVLLLLFCGPHYYCISYVKCLNDSFPPTPLRR